jgi:hypothetical protein
VENYGKFTVSSGGIIAKSGCKKYKNTSYFSAKSYTNPEMGVKN